MLPVLGSFNADVRDFRAVAGSAEALLAAAKREHCCTPSASSNHKPETLLQEVQEDVRLTGSAFIFFILSTTSG